jgi:hypothetical protein
MPNTSATCFKPFWIKALRMVYACFTAPPGAAGVATTAPYEHKNVIENA